MPIKYDVDQAENLVTTRFYGRITNEDLFDYQTRLHADPRYTAGMHELVLTAEATDVDASAGAVFSIGMQAVEKSVASPDIRIAIHAPTDRLFGLARVYTSVTEESGWHTRVFRDLEAAREWLNQAAPDASEEDE